MKINEFLGKKLIFIKQKKHHNRPKTFMSRPKVLLTESIVEDYYLVILPVNKGKKQQIMTVVNLIKR